MDRRNRVRLRLGLERDAVRAEHALGARDRFAKPALVDGPCLAPGTDTAHAATGG